MVCGSASRLAALGALLLTAGCAGAAGEWVDLAQDTELARWAKGNLGPKSTVEHAPGPQGLPAMQVTCVFEPQLSPQQHSPTPYMTLRRPLDGAALAQAKPTRFCFWHRGDGVNVVFEEQGRGDCFYTSVTASPQWRRVVLPLHELRLGWNAGGPSHGGFDLARIEALHFGIGTPKDSTRQYAVAGLTFERSDDDLDPRTFLGPRQPARLTLYPATANVPVNRRQPLLAVVANERGCPLDGVAVELRLTGAGTLSAGAGQLTTGADGRARATYQPAAAGSTATITARVAGLPAATVTLTATPPLNKVHLAPDGFFADGDNHRVIPLGGLFLPWWGEVADGELKQMSRLAVIGGSEAQQQAWFAYLQANGVNCVRGYWPVGDPLKIGPNGTTVVHQFDLNGKINEPVVAALERTLAIAGQHGIGVVLTIADCTRHFLGGYGYRTELGPDKTRRQLLREGESFLRAFVPRLATNPNIWAYELTNEQGTDTLDWSSYFIQVIKDLDPYTPVMVSHGGGGVQTADPLAWMTQTGLDVYQPHLYPDKGHSLWGPTVEAGLLQDVHYNAMAGPKPWMLGESGGYGTHPPLGAEPDAPTQRYLARDCIWFALLNRSIGAFIWGIKHHATTQFKLASQIAATIDWPALSTAQAPVAVTVPRGATQAAYFRTNPGKQALEVLANYERWSLTHGVPLDFPAVATGYREVHSAAEPFTPPAAQPLFTSGAGWQLKARVSADGRLAVGYLRNVASIELYCPPTPQGSRWTVTGSHIRKRQPAPVSVGWQLPRAGYQLTVWDLDTGEKVERAGQGQDRWTAAASEHDYVLVWRAGR